MTKTQKVSLLALRLALGLLFFYAGVTKVMDPSWTAAGFLAGAKSFPGLFAFFASPSLIGITNFLNAWGLTILGLSLVLGLFVRVSAPLGMVLMALYYLAQLDFPYPDAHSYLVDEHIIYILALFVLLKFKAENCWGLKEMLKKNRV
ncbi:MAG: DoxX family membrane protein [Patescibacteria group bacterium]